MQGLGETERNKCVRAMLCFFPTGCPAAAASAYAWTALGWLLVLWELHVAVGYLQGWLGASEVEIACSRHGLLGTAVRGVIALDLLFSLETPILSILRAEHRYKINVTPES